MNPAVLLPSEIAEALAKRKFSRRCESANAVSVAHNSL